ERVAVSSSTLPRGGLPPATGTGGTARMTLWDFRVSPGESCVALYGQGNWVLCPGICRRDRGVRRGESDRPHPPGVCMTNRACCCPWALRVWPGTAQQVRSQYWGPAEYHRKAHLRS